MDELITMKEDKISKLEDQIQKYAKKFKLLEDKDNSKVKYLEDKLQ